jgi:transposase
MIGIDVSKNTLACSLVEASSQERLWYLTLPNTPEGVETLLRKTPPQTPWVLEPTGRYSTRVVQQAYQAGQSVRVASARHAKAFLQSLQSRAKTDKLDSLGLALFGLSRPLPAYPLKEAALETIDQLLSARKGLSGSLSRLQLQQKELPQAAAFLKEAIADLKQRMRQLDQEIARLSAKNPAMAASQELKKVPGIGPVTAAAVTARLAAKSFAHPDQFVAYLGLDVDKRESGQRKGERGLTHQGDAELRRLLYVCAQANLRCKESPFKQQYQRERAKGLSSTAALCAVARKLARLCWSLHKHGTVYDPARVHQQPRREKSPHTASETEIS